MRLARRAATVFQGVFRRRQLEEDLDAELRACLEILVERRLQQGVPLERARREARQEFGGLEQVKERVREVRAGTAIETVLRDLRLGCRTLRRSSGFTAIAVLTLALGIGVNAAIFSVVYAVLLRPLPYEHPEQLALIWSTFEKAAATRAPTSGIALREIRRRSNLLEDVAGIWVGTATFTGNAHPELVRVAFVTPNFLELLGARPALGRVLAADEGAGSRRALVLSHGLWRRRFGGDPDIIGKAVSFDGTSATVVGVMAQDFRLLFPTHADVPADVQAFSPFPNDIYRDPVTLFYLRVLVRLKPGVNAAQAQADLDATAAQIRGVYPELGAENMKLDLLPLQRDAVAEIRRPLIALFGGAGFVLLICWVNVASLQLARASARRPEMALRSALGATPGRILRQLLLEGLVLCTLAGAVGLVLGWAAVRCLALIQPPELSRMQDIGLHWPAVGFVAAVSLVAAILFGLAPSVGLASWPFSARLQEAGRGTAAPVKRGARAALIVAEVTLGFVLAVGAGLMIRSLAKIQQVHPGFEARRLLTFEIDLSRHSPADQIHFVEDYEAKLATVPGVESVGGVSHLPLDDYPNWYGPYRPEGVAIKDHVSLAADHRAITPGYLRAMGTKLVAGRFFDARDRAGGPQVAMVDEMLARSAWPGSSAIGKRIEAEHFTSRGIVPVWSQVVGVVEHVRNHSLAKSLRAEIYLPFAQSPREHLSFAVRTRTEPLALAGSIRQESLRLDQELALGKVRPMAAYVERATAPASFTAVLAGVFAGLALLLAAIGLYGVISYSVSRRMHEMGVRMALGASRTEVLRLVMGEGSKLTAAGMILGVAGALLLSRALRDLLYGIPAVDPVTYVTAVAMSATAALLGCWRPAHRAALANPVDVLRSE